MSDNLDDWFGSIPQIDAQEAQGFNIKDDFKLGAGSELYAEDATIRRYNGYLYFSGNSSPGRVCVGELLNYRVAEDDVVARDPPTRCSATNVVYRRLRFR